MEAIKTLDDMIALAQIIEESGNKIIACRTVQQLFDISLNEAVNIVAQMLANPALHINI